MAYRLVALGGAALALLILAAAGPADAHGSPGGHSMGGMMAGPSHHHHHNRVFIGVPFAYGYYYGDGHYEGASCYWLKRRALNTGSRYWWNRYYACVDSVY